MKTITANSKTYSIPEKATVAEFLSQLQIKTQWVVVERNGEPIARAEFAKTSLNEGDRLEIVTPIAGG